MALYGKPSLSELDKALARLHDPMDRTAPIEVMLREVEEIQMFLLANPDEDRQQKETQLITYTLIKIANTGLYSKAIERWSGRDVDDRCAWADFRAFMIREYERMLREGGGPTTGQEGWGGAFNAAMAAAEESNNNDSSLLASITTYAERATAAESEVSAMKGQIEGTQAQMAALLLNPVPYCTMAPPMMQQPTMIPPQMAMMGTQAVPPTIAVPQQQQQQQQQFGAQKKRKSPNVNMGQQQQWTMPQQPGGAPGQMWQQQQWQQQNPWKPQGGNQNANLPNAPYSNTQKHFQNLKYCFSCGYDVDHDGSICPDPKQGHIPNVHCDQAHLVPNASMRAQLPDGTGAGKGWLLAQAANKGFFTMAQQGQQPWATLYQNNSQQQGRGRRSRGRKNRGYTQGQQFQYGMQPQWNQWGRN
jgi:hypothetical protein